jgi:RNA polymerase sigma-70 factor, ECF subfamily
MAKLPPAQRAAVIQRYYLGMSEAEMAGGGGSPPGTIKRRPHAARRKLSKLLRPQFREAPALSRDGTEGGSDRG